MEWPDLGEFGTAWSELEEVKDLERNVVANPRADLRLFEGAKDEDVRVVLFRDYHFWCPYCMKMQAWLEEKRVSYRVRRVTMFCYGQKEQWYKQLVPSGMLPAVELDGRVITESDIILLQLEKQFGPLGQLSLEDEEMLKLRSLERLLFRAWCTWLCYPNKGRDEARTEKNFITLAKQVEDALSKYEGPFFLEHFSAAEPIFHPYLDRMAASLFFWKGYNLRKEHPKVADWFNALEERPTFRGLITDFHTHAHDLPPQMGGCFSNGSKEAREAANLVNEGPWFSVPDVSYPEPPTAKAEAVARVVKHRENIIKVNPVEDKEIVDTALRQACTLLATGTFDKSALSKNADIALRYVRDRINVPRDMSIYASKHMRTALETVAAAAGPNPGPSIPTQHRRDQDPKNFL